MTRASGLSPGRRAVVRTFVAVWLALQTGIPLARKFELPSLRYRHATFSWGMFSRVPLQYRATIEREAPDGTRTPVTDLARYTQTLRPRADGLYTESRHGAEHVEAWFGALARHIAADGPPGHACRIALDWVSVAGSDRPAHWEVRETASR